MCEGRKELARTTGRQQLILFSEIIGAFLFRIFCVFLHVHTTQIYCHTGAIISETHIIKITMHNTTRSSTKGNFSSMKYCCFFPKAFLANYLPRKSSVLKRKPGAGSVLDRQRWETLRIQAVVLLQVNGTLSVP
jgi:hypothetical protein